MQIVYSEDEVSEELLEYKKELEGYGAKVFLVKTGTEMKCVLKSQIIRVLAFLLPFVQVCDYIHTYVFSIHLQMQCNQIALFALF